MKTGVDVSYHQTKIDWAKAHEDGVEFAIIRAGFGKNNPDTQAHYNALRCNAENIPIGLYWFSYAYTKEMARAEARYCLEFAKMHLIELPIYFDYEYKSDEYAKQHGVNVPRGTYCKFVEAFCNEIEKAGYYAGFYCNNDYRINKTTPNLIARYDMWLADYNQPTSFNISHMVQNTEKGRVYGIPGMVDIDVTDRDYPAIIRKAGLNNIR